MPDEKINHLLKMEHKQPSSCISSAAVSHSSVTSVVERQGGEAYPKSLPLLDPACHQLSIAAVYRCFFQSDRCLAAGLAVVVFDGQTSPWQAEQQHSLNNLGGKCNIVLSQLVDRQAGEVDLPRALPHE
jgi:hypothetical protein